MPVYLLDCTCGEQVSVGDQQAGGQVTCKCGNAVAVPTLRKLRHLPQPAAPGPVATRSSGTWGPRSRVASLGGLLSVVLLAVAGWSWATIPRVQTWDDIRDDFVADRERAVQGMTPTTAFMVLEQEYRPLVGQGFAEVQIFDPNNTAKIVAEKTWQAQVLAIAGAAVAVVTGVLVSMMPARRG